jgi:hypothetical protein
MGRFGTLLTALLVVWSLGCTVELDLPPSTPPIPVENYAGSFEVLYLIEINSCGAEYLSELESTVEIVVRGDTVEVVQSDSGVIETSGQIFSDGFFTAGETDEDLFLDFTGQFEGEDSFSAIFTINGDCEVRYLALGTRER